MWLCVHDKTNKYYGISITYFFGTELRALKLSEYVLINGSDWAIEFVNIRVQNWFSEQNITIIFMIIKLEWMSCGALHSNKLV